MMDTPRTTYQQGGFVYFMKPVGQDGPIKIGYSQHPRLRLAQVREWSPVPLELICEAEGTLAIERQVQDCFAFAHSHSEWFSPVPTLVAAIKAIKAGSPIHEAIDLTSPSGSIHATKIQKSRALRGTSQEVAA